MVMDRVMAKAVVNYILVDGDPEKAELSQDAEAGRNAKTTNKYWQP